MLETRIDEGAAEQVVDDSRLPILFEPGNPFGMPQEAFIETAAKGKRSFSLQASTSLDELLKGLQQPLNDLLQNQVGEAKADLAARPNNPYALNNLGVACLNAGKFDEAASHFKQALAIAPSYLPAGSNLAKLYAATNRLEEAIRTYQELSQAHPKNSVVLMNLGLIYVQRGEYQLAEEILDRVISLEPNNAQAYCNRGMVRGVRRQVREAVADLRNALKIAPSHPATYNNLGVCFLLLGSPKKAIRSFKTALILDPLNEPATENLAQVYLSLQTPEPAIDLLRDYLQARPEDFEARVVLARAYFLLGKHNHSVQHLSAALEIVERKGLKSEIVDILNNLGVVYQAQCRWDGAREFYGRSLAIQPKNLVALRNLASVFFELEDLPAAKEVIDYYHEHFPSDPIAYALTGIYHAINEEYDDALLQLERAIAMEPDRPLPYGWLTTILVEVKGDCRLAIERLEHALQLFPHDKVILNNLAYSYLMLGDTEKARSILDGIDEKRYDSFLTATKGLLLLKEGDKERANYYYNEASRQAATRELKNLVLQKKNLELGRDALRRGDRAEAVSLLRHSLTFKTQRHHYFKKQSKELLHDLEEGRA